MTTLALTVALTLAFTVALTLALGMTLHGRQGTEEEGFLRRVPLLGVEPSPRGCGVQVPSD